LWADRLYVSLAPEMLACARVGGLLRRRLLAKGSVECDPQFGERPWDGAVEALRGALAALGKERLHVTVVLSSRFVRCAIVPFDPAVSGPEEELALARFHFTKVHGERAKEWELRLSVGDGRPRLASAVDGGLCEAIRKCFPRSGPKLVSIQPYLMAAYNRARPELARQDAWLVLLEQGRACFALASRRGWQAVQSLRLQSGAPGELLELLEREGLRAGEPALRRALVDGAAPQAAAGWQLRPLAPPRLEGYAPLADARYAMALSAL